MPRADVFREFVEARAGGACEYCRLLQRATGVTFHIEHFQPQVHGGETNVSNLVLSCPGCNLAKGDRIVGRDESGKLWPFFNPREYESWLLGWHLHFILDHDSGLIVPRTDRGEATLLALNMNSRDRTFARKLQIDAGLIA